MVETNLEFKNWKIIIKTTVYENKTFKKYENILILKKNITFVYNFIYFKSFLSGDDKRPQRLTQNLLLKAIGLDEYVWPPTSSMY